MRKVLILLAGYPATGKSTFCRSLLGRYPDIPVVVPDDIKETLWDEVGFDSAQEKEELDRQMWVCYYARIESLMGSGTPIITDYPFSDKQKPTLTELVRKHGYHPVTVRFVGDLDEIYRRSLARDLSQERHLGHLMSHYHRGDYLADRTKADSLVTRELLEERCVGKGYGKFHMGELIEVNATGEKPVNYAEIVDELERVVGGLK